MDNNEIVTKLASSLDNEGMAALGELLQKVAAWASQKDADIKKLAQDLVDQGFSMQEIDGAIAKIAEEKKLAAECNNIVQDCVAMGVYMGKTAASVFIGEVQEFIKKNGAKTAQEGEEEEGKEAPPAEEAAAKPAEEAAEGKEGEGKEEEEEEGEEEKKAAVQRRIDILKKILENA